MKKYLPLFFLALFFPFGAHAQQSMQLCQNVTTNGTTVCTPISNSNPLYISGGSAGNLNIGTTSITGGTTTYVLYDNGGVLGNEQVPTSTGDVTFAAPSAGTTTATVVGIEGISAAALTPVGTSGYVVASNGTGFVWQAATAQTLGTSAANPAPYGTNTSTDGAYETSTVPFGISCAGTACAQFNQYGVSIGTANSTLASSGTAGIILNNNAQQTITVGSSASGVGNNLVIDAGQAASGAGGNLVLNCGVATSTNACQLQYGVYYGSTQLRAFSAKANSSSQVFVGLGTSTLTYNVNLASNAAQTMGPVRAFSSTGANLTINGGGATSAASNANGGNLILDSGLSTGTGTSNIQFNVFAAGSSGTNDNSATLAMTLNSTGTVTLNTTQYTSCTALTTNGSAVIGCTGSDAKIKDDEGIITPSEGLTDILAMPDAHKYEFKPDMGPTGVHYGFFAQDVAKVDPALVHRGTPTQYTPDGTLQYDDKEEIGKLVPAVKALQGEIDDLRRQAALPPRKCNIFCRAREFWEGL